ncbi:MAG: 3-hydroxylacyl-ACP dehydratase [Steroidobacteraceae bacterium]
MSEKSEFHMSQLLPHAGRMLLLDELLAHHAEGIEVALTIRADSVLCDGVTGVPAWVGMEYMAQAACAYSGVQEVRDGKRPSISLLLGARSYQAQVPVFALDSRLVVSAQMVMCDDADMAVFQCSIRDAATGQELAVGDIKAVRPADIQALVRAQLHG